MTHDSIVATDGQLGRTGRTGGPSTAELAAVMAEAAEALRTAETVSDVLDRLVRTACTTIPGAEFAGVSLARRDGIETAAASDPLVEEADRLQYELGEGPCLDAMTDHTKVVVTDMRHDPRWPRFAPRAAELGVLSQMGIEIFDDGSTVGGLNLYAGRPGAFDDTTEHAASLFAVHAALALEKTMTVTHLTEALRSRQTIGEAVGITMHRFTLNERAAFAYLTRVSQNSNIKLRDIAQTIVDQANAAADQTGHRSADQEPTAWLATSDRLYLGPSAGKASVD